MKKESCKKCKQCGGRISMPLEYYGGNSGAYVEKLEGAADSAYGKTIAQSFGMPISGINAVGPNMDVHPKSSGTMTGGSKKTKKSKKGKKNGKKSKKQLKNKIVKKNK